MVAYVDGVLCGTSVSNTVVDVARSPKYVEERLGRSKIDEVFVDRDEPVAADRLLECVVEDELCGTELGCPLVKVSRVPEYVESGLGKVMVDSVVRVEYE